MKPTGFARSQAYWYRFGWGTLMALLASVAGLIFVVMMEGGLHLLWHGQTAMAPFSGTWRTLLIMTGAGLLVGGLHKVLQAEEVDVFSAIPEGTMDRRPVVGALLVALVSIIGGFSLGPEGPVGILAGGLSVWVADKKNLPHPVRRTTFFSAIAGAFAGLFTAPFAVIAMGLELKHRQSGYYYGTLAIIAVSSLLGFSVFYGVQGNHFAGVLRFLELPVYPLALWHLPVAVLLGVVAAAVALIFALLMKTLHPLMAGWHHRPILRCGLVGFWLGLLAMVMPLTQFLGSEGLKQVVENQASLSPGFLLSAALLKLLATTTALAAGFIGGPIFPLFFAGGTLGVLVAQLLPGIPLMLSVGCLMAGVPGAIVPFPLTLGLIVLLITGTPVEQSIPVMITVLTAHLVLKGVILKPSTPLIERFHDIDAEIQDLREESPLLADPPLEQIQEPQG